jgi:hypothetical protein
MASENFRVPPIVMFFGFSGSDVNVRSRVAQSVS